MSGVVELRSRVAAPLAQVWAHASSMTGVNRELMPLVRMTHPPDARLDAIEHVPLDQVLFRSTLLAFGLLPFDRHSLRLRGLEPPYGFDEDSWSWLHRHWRHRRRLTAIDDRGTEVHDRVEFEPRLPGTTWLVRALVRRVFEHRHAVLERMFGARSS